jgi:glucose/mannose-6-phosphate isomerase
MTLPRDSATLAAGSSWLELDSDDMLGATVALPDHVDDALATTPGTEALEGRGPFRSVVVAGMGGSGVAGRVLKSLADSTADVPVVLAGGYDLPNFAGPDTLLIAVSFSGGTEETVSVARQAVERGVPMLAVTTGGELGRIAREAGAALESLPVGIPWPRAGVGAMVARLLRAAEALGILPPRSATEALNAAAAQLRRRLQECGTGGGIAADVAGRVGHTVPLVHGASGLGEVAARRFKTQVNENAKALAFAGEQPEVCHNELCGFDGDARATDQALTLVGLRLGTEHPQIRRRFELFAELARPGLAGFVDVEADGEGDLSRFFDLVLIGDLVSLHLAARDKVDPGPVPVLGEVKARLAEGGSTPGG